MSEGRGFLGLLGLLGLAGAGAITALPKMAVRAADSVGIAAATHADDVARFGAIHVDDMTHSRPVITQVLPEPPPSLADDVATHADHADDAELNGPSFALRVEKKLGEIGKNIGQEVVESCLGGDCPVPDSPNDESDVPLSPELQKLLDELHGITR